MRGKDQKQGLENATVVNRRKNQLKRKRVLAVLGCVVVLMTALALMVPAISITKDVAEQTEGIDLQATPDASELQGAESPAPEEPEGSGDDQGTPEDEADAPASDDPAADEPSNSSDDQGSASADSGDSSSATASDEKSDSTAATDKDDSKDSADKDEADRPAQDFKGEVLDGEGNVVMTIIVEAPKGAFPAGTEMQIEALDADSVADKVEAAIQDDPAIDGTVKSMTAIDIRFVDKKGNEIEPAKNVEVRITSGTVAEIESPVLVHVVDKSKDSAKGKTADAEVVKKVDVVDEEATDDTLKFKTKEFSPYVIVEMESLTTQVIAASGETYNATVSYVPEAEIPEGAELVVTEIAEGDEAYAEYLDQVNGELGGDVSFARFFDITIMSDGEAVQPAVPVSVSIELADATELSDSVQAVHFADEGGVEVLDASLQGETVSFTADSFSVYAVVDDPIIVNESRMTLNFYGKDQSAPLATVYVKNGDDTLAEIEQIVYDPGAGTLESGELFKGWILDKENYTTEDVANKMDIAQIRAWALGKATNNEIVEGEVHNFYAMIYKTFSVCFKAEDGVTIHSEALIFLASEGSVDYTVNVPYTPKDPDEAFQGWYFTTISDEGVVPAAGTSAFPTDTSGRAYVPNDTRVTISDNVTFTVSVPIGHWLSFVENGDGASYTPPQFIQTGNKPEEPEDPTRLGYEFGGWYENAACTGDQFDFNQVLQSRTTLYAKWISKETAKYAVIIWQRNVDDTGYDFVESVTLEGPTNTTVNTVTQQGTGNNAYARVNGVNKQYTGFHLKEFDQNVTIKPEGNAVVNVYYDRIEYTLRFFYARSYDYNVPAQTNYNQIGTTSNNGTPQGFTYDSSNTYWGYRNGQYIQLYYRTSNGRFYRNASYNNTYSGNVYLQETTPAGTRTYIQVNANNEGFLRHNGGTLEGSLSYYLTNDYQRLTNGNTWKDVNNSSINGNPLNLVNSAYLAKEEVTSGSIQINNVQTDVVTNSTTSDRQRVNTTYYYLDVKVRYGQSLEDLWPTPETTFIAQDLTSYNRPHDNMAETTVTPLLTGSWASRNNISGKYQQMTMDLFEGDSTIAYFDTYWRIQDYYHYTYNVYFSTLDGEVGQVSYKGNDYVLQESYSIGNGVGWGAFGQGAIYPADSGYGFADVATVTFDGTDVAGRVDSQTGSGGSDGTINVYYNRKVHNIVYRDGVYVNGNGVVIQNRKGEEPFKETRVIYGQDISPYAEGQSKYYEPDPLTEYVFDGWYMDSEGQQPYTFSGTMPDKDIEVYAKWIQRQYRVFLHPNVPTSDNTFDMGGQSTCFRVDYGEKIAGGNTINGTRDDYELIGWYTDEACTHPFNFDAFVLNDTTVTTPYDQTDETELDKYGNVKPGQQNVNSDAQNHRYWITKKLDLYAKWRAKLEGANGINVVYYAGDGDNAPEDSLTYLDNAEATAGAASTPNSQDKQFLHWVVQKWNGTAYEDTNVIVYPGNTYTVLKENAKVVVKEWVNPNDDTDVLVVTDPQPGTTLPDGTHTKIKTATYTVQLRAEYGDKDAPTPTHINWYPNYGTNEALHKDENLQINQAVDIQPVPTRDGYTFLGWARVEEAAGHPVQDLTASDLFLKYEDGVFKAQVTQGSEAWTQVSKVAADERQPYHDMYAVWEKSYKVTVQKVVSSDWQPDHSESFTFTPTKNVHDVSTQGDPFALSDGQSKEVYTDMPKNSHFTVPETDTGKFNITVTAKYTDYQGAEHEISGLSNGSNIEVLGDTVVTVTNTRKTAPIVFAKTDKSGETSLTGATFNVLRYDESLGRYVDYTPISSFTIDSIDGVLKSLIEGKYKLVETQAPTGFVILDETKSLLFTVNGDGTVTLDSGASDDVISISGPTGGKYTITIKNTPGHALPSTGGPGTAALTVIGVALIVVAAIMLITRRRPAAARSGAQGRPSLKRGGR